MNWFSVSCKWPSFSRIGTVFAVCASISLFFSKHCRTWVPFEWNWDGLQGSWINVSQSIFLTALLLFVSKVMKMLKGCLSTDPKAELPLYLNFGVFGEFFRIVPTRKNCFTKMFITLANLLALFLLTIFLTISIQILKIDGKSLEHIFAKTWKKKLLKRRVKEQREKSGKVTGKTQQEQFGFNDLVDCSNNMQFVGRNWLLWFGFIRLSLAIGHFIIKTKVLAKESKMQVENTKEMAKKVAAKKRIFKLRAMQRNHARINLEQNDQEQKFVHSGNRQLDELDWSCSEWLRIGNWYSLFFTFPNF